MTAVLSVINSFFENCKELFPTRMSYYAYSLMNELLELYVNLNKSPNFVFCVREGKRVAYVFLQKSCLVLMQYSKN
jgi:hypothetical protein